MTFQKIDDDFSKYGKILSTEFKTLLKDNINFLAAMIPLGQIAPIMTNIPGVPIPDANIWQECNGSEITNENSPLRSIGAQRNFTPNMIERYIRVPSSFGFSGIAQGENNTFTFRHNHGGFTGFHNPGGDVDRDNDRSEARRHRHQIFTSFPNPVNVEPTFFTVKFFMRIQ